MIYGENMMNILQYLKEHRIVSIGYSPKDKCIASELICDDARKLIECVAQNDCYISEILWWDRASIALGSKIGYGGPCDPRDPQNFYFAETDICASFAKSTTISEYIKYLDEIKERYIMYDLYPAFDIYKK